MQVGAKENLARQLTKALGDAEMWKQKYEIDGMAKAEELEMARLKLQARLSEGQAVIEQLSLKLAQLEKARAKTSAETTEMAQLLDQVRIYIILFSRKKKISGSNNAHGDGEKGEAIRQDCRGVEKQS